MEVKKYSKFMYASMLSVNRLAIGSTLAHELMHAWMRVEGGFQLFTIDACCIFLVQSKKEFELYTPTLMCRDFTHHQIKLTYNNR